MALANAFLPDDQAVAYRRPHYAHVHDLALLLDAWRHDRVVLVGHSFGTSMASYFLLAHPDCVAGLIQIAGPFLDPWREADRAAQRARCTDEQQTRLDELEVIASRTDAEEIEYLTLSWFTDHADRTRAWDWALAAARTLRPINYAMNTQLNAAKKADPLESHVDELRERPPPDAVIIGGAGDSRPADALRRLGTRLDCEVIIIPSAGHYPCWKHQTSSVQRYAPQWAQCLGTCPQPPSNRRVTCGQAG